MTILPLISSGVIFFMIFQSATTRCLRPRQDYSTGTARIGGRPQDFRRRMWFMQDLVPAHFIMPESCVSCTKDWAGCFFAHSNWIHLSSSSGVTSHVSSTRHQLSEYVICPSSRQQVATTNAWYFGANVSVSRVSVQVVRRLVLSDWIAVVESSWNVMAHGDAREGKWRGNWRMEWVASSLHTTSEHVVSSITTADAHTSAASSRLNWRPRRFKWTRLFRRKKKSGFCAWAITFQKRSTACASTAIPDRHLTVILICVQLKPYTLLTYAFCGNTEYSFLSLKTVYPSASWYLRLDIQIVGLS